MRLLIGLMIAAMGIILFIGIFPALSDQFDVLKGCENFNCVGYVDPDATADPAICDSTNESYDSTLEEDSFGCTVVSFSPAFLILAILMAVIMFVLYGSPEKPTPEYGYS